MKSIKVKVITILAIAAVIVAGVLVWLMVGKEKGYKQTLTPERVLEQENDSSLRSDRDFKFLEIQEYCGDSESEKLNELYRTKLGIENPEKEMQKTSTDEGDETEYIRYQQMYDEIPVYGRSVAICKNNKTKVIDCITSNYLAVNPSMEQKLKKEDAEEKAQEWMKEEYGVEESRTGSAEQVIYSFGEWEEDPVLCWTIRAAGIDTDGFYQDYRIFLDANSGMFITKQETRDYLMAPCIAPEQDGKIRTVTSDFDSETYTYTMMDTERKIYIKKPDGDFSWTLGRHDVADAAKKVTWKPDESVDPSAVDAMYNISQIRNFYNNFFQRKALRDNNSNALNEISVVVHVKKDYNEEMKIDKGVNNACFTETLDTSNPLIAFFDNVDEEGNPIADYAGDIAVCGHEYTHGIIRYTSALLPEGEPRALNEAAADIMGIMIRFACPENPLEWQAEGWQINSRDLSDPQVNPEYPYMSHMDQWADKPDAMSWEDFNRYAHYWRSTIMSNVAYQAFVGMDTENYTKEETAISDPVRIAKLWYYAIEMMHSDSTFTQCRALAEHCADNMLAAGELTQAQREGLTAAFEKNGIGIAKNVSEEMNHEMDDTDDTKTAEGEPGTESGLSKSYTSDLSTGMVTECNGFVYYIDSIDSGSGCLWRMKEDGSEKQQLTQVNVSQITAWGNYIFYLKNESGTLCRMNNTQPVEETVNKTEERVERYTLGTEWLSYRNEEGNITCIDPETLEKISITKPEAVEKPSVLWYGHYGAQWYFVDGSKLYCCDNDGENQRMLSDLIQNKDLDEAFQNGKAENFQVVDGDFYFLTMNIGIKLYRLPCQQTKIQLINEDFYIGSYRIYKGGIYYLGEDGFYCYKPDTKQKIFIMGDGSASAAPSIWGFSDNWMYLKDYNVIPQQGGLPMEIQQISRVGLEGGNYQTFLSY